MGSIPDVLKFCYLCLGNLFKKQESSMSHIENLHIKNFGPIDAADVKIKKITVLIGTQGAGKSTIAKLYSLFTWLEKSLMRHSLSEKYITQYARFRKKYCAYNRIDGYFRDDTELRFDGVHYVFDYQNGVFSIEEKEHNAEDFYLLSKVMYVPAERIILGCTDHPSRLKGLNESMVTFLEEYENAKRSLNSGYKLPFDDASFEYDMLNDISKLRYKDYDVKLSDGASGFQSSLPLLLVAKDLTDKVSNSLHNSDTLSEKERNALQKAVERIMSDDALSEDVKMASLRSISSKYSYSRLVNVVEEMELNLYPESQKSVLFELIENVRKLDDNRLFLTTHSPYIINFLTLAIKAGKLADKADGDSELLERINEIVPLGSVVDQDEWSVLEVGDGTVRELKRYDGMPSDENYLNTMLANANEMFDALLEIEEELENG